MQLHRGDQILVETYTAGGTRLERFSANVTGAMSGEAYVLGLAVRRSGGRKSDGDFIKIIEKKSNLQDAYRISGAPGSIQVENVPISSIGTSNWSWPSMPDRPGRTVRQAPPAAPRVKKVKWPSVEDVARGLRAINDEVAGYRRSNPETFEECDVRLQVSPDSSWKLWSGSSDYASDHRGYWGSGSVPGGRFDSKALAKDLIGQCQDDSAGSYDGSYYGD